MPVTTHRNAASWIGAIPRPEASRSLRAAVLFVFCAGLVLSVPFLGNPVLYALVAAMLVCWLVPIWSDLQRGRFDAFESVHVMGLRYFAFFGLGAVWTYQDPQRVAFDRYTLPYLNEATFYCLLGYLALLAGYYAPWFRAERRRRWCEMPTGLVFVLVPGLIGLLGSMAAAALARAAWSGLALSAIVSSLGQLAPLFQFGWALCWLLVFSHSITRRQRLVLLALFVPATVLIVFSNLTDKSLVMSLAVVPLIALWYARRKLPWKTLVVLGIVLIFVIFPFFNTYRYIDARIDTSKRVAMTSRIISHWDAKTYLAESVVSAQGRLALINSVAVVVRDTGRWVPYAKGETLFVPTLAYFVPRVLWPDKPVFTLGREFGQTFRMVHVLDDKTSISATVPGELFWNFDLPGVVFGMALWGIALRWFYRRYGEADAVDPVRHAIHIVLLIQFVHFGAGLAAQVMLVVRTLIMIEAFRWVAHRAGLLELREPGPAA